MEFRPSILVDKAQAFSNKSVIGYVPLLNKSLGVAKSLSHWAEQLVEPKPLLVDVDSPWQSMSSLTTSEEQSQVDEEEMEQPARKSSIVETTSTRMLFYTAKVFGSLFSFATKTCEACIDTMEQVLPVGAQELRQTRDRILINACSRFSEPDRRFRGITSAELSSFHVYSSGNVSEILSFSFSSSSFLVLYELGVAQAIQESFKSTILAKMHFLGSGSGSLPAACLALHLDIKSMAQSIIDKQKEIAARCFGPLGIMSEQLNAILEDNVFADVEYGSDRLFISLTKLPTGTNYWASHFDDKQDLINAVQASCYVPLVFETPVTIDGQFFGSGGLSERQPMKKRMTVTVSPYPGRANISPILDKYSRVNELLPCPDPKTLLQTFADGYKDGMDWINDMCGENILSPRVLKRHTE